MTQAVYIDGQQINGEHLRRALYASTAGASGITRSSDLRVSAYSTPGGGVNINRGGGIVATAFVDADGGQSYALSVSATTQLSIPASGASAKTWQIIFRVTDPQYLGEPVPPNPSTASYGILEAVASLPTGKPYLHLATIVVPANTATITNAMITDRRKLALPRSERILKAQAIPSADPLDSTAGFEQWPDSALWSVMVPEWATEARVVFDWRNIASMPGTNISELSVLLGWNRPDKVQLNSSFAVLGMSASSGSGEQRRQTIGVADTIAIPASMRGQLITVMGWAKKKSGSVNLIADAWSSCSLDIQFLETPLSDVQ